MAALKPSEHPIEFAIGAPAFVEGVISTLIFFGWVTPESIEVVRFWLNVVAALWTYFWLKRMATSRAKPTAADGTPLEPVKPATRGIPLRQP